MKAAVKLLPFLIITVVGCRSSEPFDNIVIADSPRAFNYISVSGQRSAAAICEDAGYYIVFDDEKRKANLTISNLHIPDMDQPVTLTFSDVEMTYTSNRHEKQRMIRSDILVSSDPITAGVSISDVVIIYTQSNSLDPNRNDGIFARYTIDGRYTVTAYPYSVFADGTTIVDNITDGTEHIDYNTTYEILFDPGHMSASLSINNLKLGSKTFCINSSPLSLSINESGYELSEQASTKINGVADMTVRIVEVAATLLDELRIELEIANHDAVAYRVSAYLTPNLSE